MAPKTPKKTPAKDSNRTPADEINETNKSYQAKDADITLVSSDGLKFKVHKWALMASSQVFRNMLETGNNEEEQSTIELTDDKIEKSTIIRIFLDLTYGRSITMFPFASNSDKSRFQPDIIKFLHKYDATYPIEMLKYAFRGEASVRDADICNVFIYGAQLDDPQICKAVIRSRNDSYYSSRSTTHVLDLTGVPYEAFESIPDKYKYALLRASAEITEGGRNIWDRRNEFNLAGWLTHKDKIAEEFERLVLE